MSCAIACKIAKIPLITTIHGQQPVHMSRKLIKGFGDYSIAVCENIQEHIINDLKVNPQNITVIRNMIDTTGYQNKNDLNQQNKKIVSIIGRLSGPKGEVTYKLLEILHKRKDFFIQVIGGKSVPHKFKNF